VIGCSVPRLSYERERSRRPSGDTAKSPHDARSDRDAAKISSSAGATAEEGLDSFLESGRDGTNLLLQRRVVEIRDSVRPSAAMFRVVHRSSNVRQSMTATICGSGPTFRRKR
jgi:hypothetical protein